LTYVFTHLGSLGFLLLLFASVGTLVDRASLRVPSADVPRLVVRVGLGAAVLLVLLFLLAAIGWLRAAVVVPAALLAVAGAVVLTVRDRRNRPGDEGETPEEETETETAGAPRWMRWVLLAAIAIVGAALVLRALSPGVYWDAGAHRLLIPKLYLGASGFRPIELNVYSEWPLNTELLYALAMMLHDHVLAKLLHCSLGVLLAVAVARYASRNGPALSGALAAALFLLNDVVRFEMHIAYVDVAFAFFLFLAFAFFTKAMDEEDGGDRSFLVAGVFCGIVAGIKLFGFFGAAALAGLLVAERFRPGRPSKPLVRPLLLLFVPTFALLAPWLVKSTIATGNPVYPFLWTVFGGPDWSAELGAQHMAWNRAIGMGRSPLDFLLLPVRVILQGGPGYEHFDGRLHAAWIVLLPVSVAGAFRNRTVRRCLVVCLVYCALWAVSSQQIRFLVPVLPLFAVAAAISITSLAKAMPRPALRTAVLGLAVVGAAVLLVHASRDDVRRAALLGRQYREAGDRLVEGAIHPTYRLLNEKLPADARLLLLNTNQGFFLEREYVADSFFEASQLAAWLSKARSKEELRDLLRTRNLTYILAENRDWGIPWPAVLGAFLEDPSFARPLHRSPDGRFLVFEVSPDTP